MLASRLSFEDNDTYFSRGLELVRGGLGKERCLNIIEHDAFAEVEGRRRRGYN